MQKLSIPEQPGVTDILSPEEQKYCLGEDYRIHERHFDPALRKHGVSGFMRLRNEAEFLPQVIESHLPYFDELVIAYNRCTDETGQIVAEYAAKFPDKIKAYCYPFFVHPQGSAKHVTTPAESVHSLVYYYNFALSRTTYSYAVKVDGDHIVVPHAVKTVYEYIHEARPREFLTFAGINLIKQDEHIFVSAENPFCGLNGDIGYFPVDFSTRFHHAERYEVFSHTLPRKECGVAFYHLKGMKKDRGISNYDLDSNPNSPYQSFKGALQRRKVLTWEQFKAQFPEVPEYVLSPEQAGIKA